MGFFSFGRVSRRQRRARSDGGSRERRSVVRRGHRGDRTRRDERCGTRRSTPRSVARRFPASARSSRASLLRRGKVQTKRASQPSGVFVASCARAWERETTHLLHLLLVLQRVVEHLLGAFAHGHHLLVLLPHPLRLFLEPIGGRRGILQRPRGPVHGLVHDRLGAFGFLEPVDVPRRLGGDRPAHVAQPAPARPGAHRVGGIHRVASTHRAPPARLAIVLEFFFATSKEAYSAFIHIRGSRDTPIPGIFLGGIIRSSAGRIPIRSQNSLTPC